MADGTVIYKICFEATGPCDSSSDVEIVPNGGPSIIVSVVENGTSSNLPASRISIDNGSVDIGCTPTCDIVSVIGSCAGENAGSVTVSGTMGGNCVWTNAAGTQVSTDCNLLGVAPGVYDLTVTYTTGDICEQQATVPTLDAPVIMGTVTNAGCGQGQIMATVTFPSGSGTFSWSPDLGQVLNPLVDAGQYTLTATDNGSGCSATEVFVVQDVVMALGLSPTSTNVSCNGAADGTIITNPSGGCPPYSFAWNGGLVGQNPTMVGPGIYTVTMTDSQGSTIEGSGITISQPDAITETSAATILDSNGADGAITVNIEGGTGTLAYSWSPGALPNSPSINGLAAGMYTLVVTDENDCTANFGPYQVIMNPITDTMDMITLTTSDNNGFGVPCAGQQTGQITVAVMSTNVPGTLTLSGASSETVAVDAQGIFVFDALFAGDYTVTYLNSMGESINSSVSITEPAEFTIDFETGCENEDQGDGFIDLNLSGGVGTLTYEWGDPNLDGATADDLTTGIYTVMVTDENGCSVMEMITIIPCGDGPMACYEFPKIITPNNDGFNEFFNASCLNLRQADLTIFNRWGQMVFEMPSYDGSWTGLRQNSDELPEGGYMWVLNITYPDSRQEVMKGTVTILRD